MNKETADVLKHIADKLDVPIEQLWTGIIAYAPFTFWQWVIGIVIGLLVTCAFAGLSFWAVRKEHDYALVCGFLSVAVITMTCAMGVATMPGALAAKYAPEAWAAKYIIESARR